jgi:SagB-type dehydrogenase family enzyme
MTLIDIDVAELFHENTKITPFENGDEMASLPEPLEPGISLARIALPRVGAVNRVTLEDAVARRVTDRQFNPAAVMPLDTLSRLLALSCGFTAVAGPEAGGAFQFHRATPSAGASFPLEIYPVLFRIQGAAPGVYRYEPGDHSLTLLRPGWFHQQIAAWTLHQSYVADTSILFVVAGFPDRVRPRYGERGYRYMLFEAGHIGQNLSLLATAYGLGSLCIGGFVDMAIGRLIGLNEITEIPLYLAAVGILR